MKYKIGSIVADYIRPNKLVEVIAYNNYNVTVRNLSTLKYDKVWLGDLDDYILIAQSIDLLPDAKFITKFVDKEVIKEVEVEVVKYKHKFYHTNHWINSLDINWIDKLYRWLRRKEIKSLKETELITEEEYYELRK